MSRRGGESERDLFGDRQVEESGGTVELLMQLVDQSAKAWLLIWKTRPGEPKWAPKSLVKRSPPPDEDVFSMPRWVARDRGWV